MIQDFKLSNFDESLKSVAFTITWLAILLVNNHLLFDSDKNLLHVRFRIPLHEQRELAGLHSSIILVYRRNIDLWLEANLGSDCGILRTTRDRQRVDSSVHVCVWWANNCAVPVSKRLVISLVETVGNALVWKLCFFGFLKLFVKPECSGH